MTNQTRVAVLGSVFICFSAFALDSKFLGNFEKRGPAGELICSGTVVALPRNWVDRLYHLPQQLRILVTTPSGATGAAGYLSKDEPGQVKFGFIRNAYLGTTSEASISAGDDDTFDFSVVLAGNRFTQRQEARCEGARKTEQ